MIIFQYSSLDDNICHCRYRHRKSGFCLVLFCILVLLTAAQTDTQKESLLPKLTIPAEVWASYHDQIQKGFLELG